MGIDHGNPYIHSITVLCDTILLIHTIETSEEFCNSMLNV